MNAPNIVYLYLSDGVLQDKEDMRCDDDYDDWCFTATFVHIVA